MPTQQRTAAAFGVLAFQCLSGGFPIPLENSILKLYQDAESLDDRVPGLPPPLVDFVLDCLERDPPQRPENGTALLNQLEELAKLR